MDARTHEPDASRQAMRASELLLATLRSWPTEDISFDELTRALGDRAYGVIMLLFSLPNCIPAPPGMNSVFGIPLLLYALQLMYSRAQPWQPQFIAARRFRVARLISLLEAAAPRLQVIERLCRPRMQWLVSGRAERLLAAFVSLLAISIIIPIWGTNFVPSIGAGLISIALVEHDGRLAMIGIVVGLIGVVITTVILRGLLWAAMEGATHMF